MTRNIYTARTLIKASIAFLMDTIANEDAGFATKFELVRGIRTEPGIASTAIHFEKLVIRRTVEQFLQWTSFLQGK